MDKAKRDIGQLKLKYFNWDHPEPVAYSWMDWWSRMSNSGICGDASVATPEFGKLLFEITISRFIETTREFRTIPIEEQVDHHCYKPDSPTSVKIHPCKNTLTVTLRTTKN